MAAPRNRGGGSSQGGGEDFTTPQEFPRTTPQLSAVDHSWVLQATMEMQKSIGQLSEAISGLRQDSKDHGEKLLKFEKILYAATIIGGVLIVVGGFLINKLWDPMIEALKAYARAHP